MLTGNDSVVRSQRAIYEALEYGDFAEALNEIKHCFNLVAFDKFKIDEDWFNETIIELQDHIDLVERILNYAKSIVALAGDNNES